MRAISPLLPLVLACSSKASAPKPAPPANTPATAPGTAAEPQDACARVAARFDVMVAPVAEVTGEPADRPAVLAHLAATRVILLDECRRRPWAEAHTTCFARSTNAAAWQACEEQLPADQRADIQKRLDALGPTEPADRARQQVRKVAFEYYPQWAMRPKNRGCPASLTEFDEYVEEPAAQPWLDPWGTALAFRCQGAMLVVTSAGPDRAPGTADDIASDSPSDN